MDLDGLEEVGPRDSVSNPSTPRHRSEPAPRTAKGLFQFSLDEILEEERGGTDSDGDTTIAAAGSETYVPTVVVPNDDDSASTISSSSVATPRAETDDDPMIAPIDGESEVGSLVEAPDFTGAPFTEFREKELRDDASDVSTMVLKPSGAKSPSESVASEPSYVCTSPLLPFTSNPTPTNRLLSQYSMTNLSDTNAHRRIEASEVRTQTLSIPSTPVPGGAATRTSSTTTRASRSPMRTRSSSTP